MTKKMTRQEAGRAGGTKTLDFWGKDYYKKIGKVGGDAVGSNRAYMAELGRRGGKKSAEVRLTGEFADKYRQQLVESGRIGALRTSENARKR